MPYPPVFWDQQPAADVHCIGRGIPQFEDGMLPDFPVGVFDARLRIDGPRSGVTTLPEGCEVIRWARRGNVLQSRQIHTVGRIEGVVVEKHIGGQIARQDIK